jgi:hypothetical protein
MEVIVVLALVCVVGYFLFKRATKRGNNTVRAYIYLCAIRDGASAEEANRSAKVDAVYLPTLTIRDAQTHIRTVYGGKQLPMITEAERLGLLL